MNLVGLDRGLAGCGGCWGVGWWESRNPTNGRQDKSADLGRAHMAGWIGVFGHFHQKAAGAFGNFAGNFKAASAIPAAVSTGAS